MILRAVLAGQHPSGKNQQSIVPRPRGRGYMRIPKASFEKWRATAYAQLDRQRGAWVKLTAPARIDVRYCPGDLITRDRPGMEDALWHLLEWCPAHTSKVEKKLCRLGFCQLPFVLNDSLLQDGLWEQLPLDRARPRLEITIYPKASGARS